MEIYEVLFDPTKDKGIYALSVVNDPAMESHFIALSKEQTQKVQLAKVDEEQRILLGVALIPDKPIKRIIEDKEVYITFPKKTIKEAAHTFLKNQYNNNSSLEHEVKLNGMTVVESWMVDNPELDKTKHYGLEAPEGSWVAAMKVEDEKVWNEYVKTGKVKGFSIDALFSLNKLELNKEQMSDKNILKPILDGLAEIKTYLSSNKEEGTNVKLATQTLKDGKTIQYEGDELAEGTEVFVLVEGEDPVALPDGEHELDDDTKVTIAEGKVTKITEAEKESEEAELAKKATELSADGVSAHLELPVGKHEIDGKIYTVEETIDNEGTDNEWKHNVIVSIVPKEGAESTEESTELSKVQDTLADLQATVKTELKAKDDKIAELEAQLSKEPAKKPLKNTIAQLSKEDYEKLTPLERYRLSKKA